MLRMPSLRQILMLLLAPALFATLTGCALRERSSSDPGPAYWAAASKTISTIPRAQVPPHE